MNKLIQLFKLNQWNKWIDRIRLDDFPFQRKTKQGSSQKMSFRASKQLQKFRTRKTIKNSKLCRKWKTERAGGGVSSGIGGWPQISTWLIRASKRLWKFRNRQPAKNSKLCWKWKNAIIDGAGPNGIGGWPPISTCIIPPSLGSNGPHCVKFLHEKKILLKLVLDLPRMSWTCWQMCWWTWWMS